MGYSFTNFLPTIVKQYNYSTISTQLHAVPPFAAAWVFSILLSFLSSRLSHALTPILFSLSLAIAGAGILLNIEHLPRANSIHIQYAALFLVAMGLFGALPIALCWFVMNLEGHFDRAVGTAWMICFGNIGGIPAVFSFQSKDAPLYHRGYIVVMFGLCLCTVSAILYGVGVYTENRRRPKGQKLLF